VTVPQASNGGQSWGDTQPQSHPIVKVAEKLKGKPYRYGGFTPEGFDCSGFVYYAYRQVGKTIPRTTRAQFRASNRLSIEDVQPGDLLFFRINSRKLSHVGLYAGHGRFIHASPSRKQIIDASLDDNYWNKRLIGVGRIP
jgi:cell wall-associated NlpC family hydrolase